MELHFFLVHILKKFLAFCSSALLWTMFLITNILWLCCCCHSQSVFIYLYIIIPSSSLHHCKPRSCLSFSSLSPRSPPLLLGYITGSFYITDTAGRVIKSHLLLDSFSSLISSREISIQRPDGEIGLLDFLREEMMSTGLSPNSESRYCLFIWYFLLF